MVRIAHNSLPLPMERFGQFEVVREIPRLETSVVYTYIVCHTDSASKEEFVVRHHLRTEDPAETDALFQRRKEAFLAAARCQKQAADAGAASVAPIHEIGEDERGAWYRADYYTRGTLKKLIFGRYDPDATDLYHLLHSTVRALLDFQRHCGRSHGALRPNNLLLGGTRGTRLRQASILLSDPLPGGPEQAAKFEIADLHALGEIIFQLIRRREIGAAVNWPIPQSDDWSCLGEQAGTWLELCNRLIDPSLSLTTFNLVALQKELEKFRPKPSLLDRVPRPGKAVYGGVGAAVLMIVLLIGNRWYARSHPSKPIPQPPVVNVPLPVQPPSPLTNVTLSPPIIPRVTVQLVSEPAGAEVKLGSRQLGATPLRVELEPGEITLRFELIGCEPVTLQTNVVAGRALTLRAQLTPSGGVAEVTSDPVGAELYWQGRLLGKTPLTVPLPAGAQQLIVRYGDLEESRVTVDVPRNGQTTAKVAFAYGRLAIVSEPVGAKIFSGNQTLGVTPYTNLIVRPGPVRYELRRGEDQPVKPVQGEVQTGQMTTLEARWVETTAAPSTVLTNGLGMVLHWVPAGYWVGECEVTQAEYEKIMGQNPSYYNHTLLGPAWQPRLPVERVAWLEATEFCHKLTDLDRASFPKWGLPPTAHYSLPTETQWEYFAADAKLENSVTSKGKRLGEGRKQPEPVGSTKVPNKFGLYDVRGNVWEWCLSDAADPTNPYVGVARGGAFDGLDDGPQASLNIQFRAVMDQSRPAAKTGLRVVLLPGS